MAGNNRFSTLCYGESYGVGGNINAFGVVGGNLNSFATAQVSQIYAPLTPLTVPVPNGNATINSIIVLMAPGGLNVHQKKLYSGDTVATLNTAGT